MAPTFLLRNLLFGEGRQTFANGNHCQPVTKNFLGISRQHGHFRASSSPRDGCADKSWLPLLHTRKSAEAELRAGPAATPDARLGTSALARRWRLWQELQKEKRCHWTLRRRAGTCFLEEVPWEQ